MSWALQLALALAIFAAGGGVGIKWHAGNAAGAPQAFATDRDVSTAIADCRASYGAVASQVNQILDIEERRHPTVP